MICGPARRLQSQRRSRTSRSRNYTGPEEHSVGNMLWAVETVDFFFEVSCRRDKFGSRMRMTCPEWPGLPFPGLQDAPRAIPGGGA
jgi:hypothetical protein